MYPTRLVTKSVGNSEDAARHLGMEEFDKDGRGNNVARRVPLVLVPSRGPGCCSSFVFVIIPKGFVAMTSRYGQYVGTWGAGFHWAPAWVGVSHMIPTQYVVYDTPVKECPTQDNVMVTIDITMVFRVMVEDENSIYSFAFKLGPEKLNEMLKAFQEDSVRGMVRHRRYDQIYDMMDTAQDKQMEVTLRDLNNQFGQFGVQITSISVTNVHLPREFAETMQEATVWHNRNEYKLLQQEYDIKKIEAREAEAKHKQKMKEDLEKFEAEYNRDLANVRKQLENEKAETAKQLAALKEKEKALVLQIKSESKKIVAEIHRQRDVLLAQKKSEGSAESERIRVEAEIEVMQNNADADAEVAQAHAQALEISGEAEATAARGLGPKRSYDQKMRSLQALRALATNPDVAIAGNNGDNQVAQLVSGQRNGGVLGINV